MATLGLETGTTALEPVTLPAGARPSSDLGGDEVLVLVEEASFGS
jgi:hypothetical protein